jgi:hypothetical protein
MTRSSYPRRRYGASPPPVITGDQIARWRLTKRERAEMAGAAMDGITRPEKPNQRQIADLFKVSLAYARLMRRPQSVPQLQAAE